MVFSLFHLDEELFVLKEGGGTCFVLLENHQNTSIVSLDLRVYHTIPASGAKGDQTVLEYTARSSQSPLLGRESQSNLSSHFFCKG